MQTGLTDSTLTRAGAQHLVVQANEYTFDAVGNLRSRLRHSLLSTPLSHDPDTLRTQLNINGVVRDVKKQEFQYDALNRLTHISHNNSAFTRWMRYADNGNITWKRDKGWYCYDTARPHAVSGIRQTESGDCNNTWQYDTWGNMTDDGARTIEYSDFDKATSVTVTATGDTTTFAYGTDRRRYKREDITADGTTRTLYFGSQERVYRLENSVWVLEKTRRNLPGAIQPLHATGNTETFYQHKDPLGSVNTLTNDRGEIVQKLYFDAWGKKVELPKTSWQWQAQAAAAPTLKDLDAVTPRGFTGHEHLDHADIIHMNGRIYDPTLGRFLQADPFIQAPKNSQSYNRYSYVLNNPLSYTDPTGYLWNKITKPFKKLGRAIIRGASKIFGQDFVRMLGNIASFACGPAAPACSGLWNYEFARAHGASSSGALRGAFTAAVGTYVGGSEWYNGLDPLQQVAVDTAIDVGNRIVSKTQADTNQTGSLVLLNDYESRQLVLGDHAKFWKSRFERGDPWAKNALGIWDPDNPEVPTYNVILGEITTSRLKQHMMLRDGLKVFHLQNRQEVAKFYADELRQIGLGLARRHASISLDSGGKAVTLYESNIYHYEVFRSHGLPDSVYGGTPAGSFAHGIQALLTNKVFSYCENGCKNK